MATGGYGGGLRMTVGILSVLLSSERSRSRLSDWGLDAVVLSYLIIMFTLTIYKYERPCIM